MARVIKTNYSIPSDSVVEEAYALARECGLVVGITDTVYGVFTSPFIEDCVKRVYKAKRRGDKPIPVLASSVDDVLRVVNESRLEHIASLRRVLESLWPGPITVVLPIRRNAFPDALHQGLGKVGFRIPAAPLPRLLASKLGGFVTGTSANISGLKPAETVSEAISQLGDRIDLYIDSGVSPLRTPSTVIELTSEGINVVREGAVSVKTIKAVISLLSA